MLIAVSDADPDVRRDAIGRVARGKQFSKDWAVKGFTTIALLESDSQTRCVAVRGLAQSRDACAAEVLLKILNYRDFPAKEVRPPDDVCRWDTTLALADLLAAGAVPHEQREKTTATLLDRLNKDNVANVRIAAARGLGWCSSNDVLRGLINGLEDENFAVVHECENALARLTGTTHGCSRFAWEQWFEANRNEPFAQAGRMPAARLPPYRNGWEKFVYDTRQIFRWAFPGKKEK